MPPAPWPAEEGSNSGSPRAETASWIWRPCSPLAERGITRVLVEGGGELAAALLRAGLVDRLAWFRAAAIMGGDGRAAIADSACTTLIG